MKLAARFSAFFLTSLAAVLIGFSLGLYFLASGYLHRQLDERLNAALETLEGSIDVEQGGLEWEPQERRLLLGTESDPDDVRWVVLTLEGAVIDRSANNPPAEFARWRPDAWPVNPPDATVMGDAPGWRMGGRKLLLEELLQLGRGHPEDDGTENDIEYPAMLILVGLDPAPVAADLRQLAWSLAGISAGLWTLCAVIGAWLGRRALAPVAHMAAAVRAMSVAEPHERVPSPGTNDELEQLAGAFNDLLSRLRAAIERERRFTGDASHQLRTPIAGLLAYVDVLRRRPRSTQEYTDGLEQVHREVLRMRQVVESLMFLARSDADAMPLEFEPLELSGWLARQLDNFKGHERAVDLHFQPPGDPLVIRTHPGLLAELFDNLLENAIKYSEPGDSVVVSVERQKGDVLVTVEDRGPGIGAADLPHLFEPFYRSAEARLQNRRGVGLGLAIVKRIVATLGAQIQVASEVGRGSRFTVRFAAAAGKPATLETVTS